MSLLVTGIKNKIKKYSFFCNENRQIAYYMLEN